jgi:GrpB-like predicted nucleotidyltransferase (UPF0157 family)
MSDQARPDETRQTSEEELRAATAGALEPLAGQVLLVEYDPAWPQLYEWEASRIRAALGDGVQRLEHVGSTSVQGLAAKPRIDILLAVANSAAEADYVPGLELAGYELRVREPDWHEHRMLRDADPDVNLHVFTDNCLEIERMLRFRDHLRANSGDRLHYQRTKRALASRTWTYLQHYADAKSAVVEEILARAAAGDYR